VTALLGGPVLPAALGALAWGAYVLALLGFALSRMPKLGLGAARLLAILPTLHVGYGLGFLIGALDLPRRSRSTRTGTT